MTRHPCATFPQVRELCSVVDKSPHAQAAEVADALDREITLESVVEARLTIPALPLYRPACP